VRIANVSATTQKYLLNFTSPAPTARRAASRRPSRSPPAHRWRSTTSSPALRQRLRWHRRRRHAGDPPADLVDLQRLVVVRHRQRPRPLPRARPTTSPRTAHSGSSSRPSRSRSSSPRRPAAAPRRSSPCSRSPSRPPTARTSPRRSGRRAGGRARARLRQTPVTNRPRSPSRSCRASTSRSTPSSPSTT